MEPADLPGLADFIAIAVHGGLNAASRATQTPKATLSRRVRQLEMALGARLLERGDRSLRLTDEGQFLLDRATPLLAELREVGDELSTKSGRLRGALHISAPSLFARRNLGAVIAAFVARYPEVHVQIEVDDSFVDPVKGGYDLIIRANPAPNTDLVGKCILRTDLVLAAPPSIPFPTEPSTEVDAVMLSSGSDAPQWIAHGPRGEVRVVPRAVVSCPSMLLVYEAAKHGAGVALLPHWFVKDEIAAGELELWGVVPHRRIEVWALHTSTRLTNPKVKAFIDVLLEHAALGPSR